MKTICIFTFLFLHHLILTGQDCVGFIQYKLLTSCVQDVTALNNETNPGALPVQLQSRHDLTFFYRYFNTSSFEEYRSLFLDGDWYDLDKSSYLEWMNYISSHKMRAEGAIRFWHKNTLWSLVQYYTIEGNYYIRGAFLMKKSGESWHPASHSDEQDLAELKGLLRSVKPGFLQFALGESNMEERELPGYVRELKKTTVKGNTLSGEKLLAEGQDQSEGREAGMPEAFYNLRERVNPEKDYARDRTNDPAMIAYMDSLGISETEKTAIIGLIKDFTYIKAAARLAKYEGSEYNLPLHLQTIRRIYGEDRVLQSERN